MIEEYFSPVSEKLIEEFESKGGSRFGNSVSFNKWDGASLKSHHIAIIGAEEDRNAKGNWGCAHAPDFVRKALYQLFPAADGQRILDLGNLRPGMSITDTYYGLAEVCRELHSYNTIPLIIGGSQDLTIAQFMGAEAMGNLLELMTIDAELDLTDGEEDKSSPENYLNHIFLNHSSNLFHYINIATQEYLNDTETLNMLENVFFESISLGDLRGDMKEFEPMVRSIDLLSFDMGSVRFSDAPGNSQPNPNGLFGHEACSISRYAGLSEKIKSIGFYNYNPTYDQVNVTATLVAQMAWYFIEGFYHRVTDIPPGDNTSYIKYIASINRLDQEIVFYRSKKSDRWWMEVPISNKEGQEKFHLVPCSYADYRKVCTEQELPEKWVKSQMRFAKAIN